MEYRMAGKGQRISVLGFGCMRFAKKGGSIDAKAAEEQIMKAYHAGVNYFDTAYIYPGSEAVLGEVLEKNGIRGEVNIATKLPQYMVKSSGAIDKYFQEELHRLRPN